MANDRSGQQADAAGQPGLGSARGAGGQPAQGDRPPSKASPQGADAGAPEFGPPGFLPPRAAQRARKIVLREQLGVGWVVASAAAAVVLLAVGVWFAASQLGPPGPPFVEVAEATELVSGEAVRVAADGHDVLLVREAGRLRAFRAPAVPVALCPESQQLEGADGTVWGLDGRRLSAQGASLAEIPVEVHTGQVYVNPAVVVAHPEPHDRAEQPACPW